MKKQNYLAFTLIELLVVIAIIGVLATLSVLSLMNSRINARDSKRLADIKQLRTGLELFFNDAGRYPDILEFNSDKLEYHSDSTGTTTYIAKMPSAPTPPDGGCSVQENNYTYNPNIDLSSYEINFCIAKQNGDLLAGNLIANPAGLIYSGPAQGEIVACVPSCGSNNCGDDGCGGSCGTCGPAQTCDGGICQSAEVIRAMDFGDTSIDEISGVCTDGTSLYWVGRSRRPGVNLYDSMVINTDKNLNVLRSYLYNNEATSNDNFHRCLVENGRLYIAGTANIATSLHGFNTSDMSLIGVTSYGRTGHVEVGEDLATTDNYIFSVASTINGYSTPQGMIMKYDKSTLAFLSRAGYGMNSASVFTDFNGLAYDGTYLYAVGYEQNSSGIIIVYDENLNIVSKHKYTDGSSQGVVFNKVKIEGDYIYIAGEVRSIISPYYDDGLLVKINKNDFSVVYSKVYGGSADDSFDNLVIDADDLYVVGKTASEGVGYYDGLVLKYRKSDLALISRKNIGNSDQGYFKEVISDASHLFIAGFADSESYAIKMDKNFYDVEATTSPSFLRYQNGVQTNFPGAPLTIATSAYNPYTTNTTSSVIIATTSIRAVGAMGPYIIQ